MARKVLTWAIVLFVIYYLVNSPAAAGHVVHGAFGWLGKAGHSLALFVNSL